MFGIGLGEVFLIILVTFLVSPREIPRVLRKLGEFVAGMRRLRQDIIDLGNDVQDIVREEIPDKSEVFPDELKKQNTLDRTGRKTLGGSK
jgi:Sec-independent protein translocase protein TatA